MAGVGKLLKDAQKMQAKLQAMQAEIALKTFEASVAGGAVVATVNGQGQLVGLKYEPDFLKEDPAMVASSTVTAVQQAQQAATAANEQQMSAITGPMKGFFG